MALQTTRRAETDQHVNEADADISSSEAEEMDMFDNGLTENRCSPAHVSLDSTRAERATTPPLPTSLVELKCLEMSRRDKQESFQEHKWRLA